MTGLHHSLIYLSMSFWPEILEKQNGLVAKRAIKSNLLETTKIMCIFNTFEYWTDWDIVP